MKTNYSTICNNKKNREKAVTRIVKAFQDAGAEVEWGEDRDESFIRFAVGPHECMMHLRKGSNVHSWLTHWHGEREYSNGFMIEAGVYSRNSFHKMKCTGGYENLDAMIRWTVQGIVHLRKELETFDRIEIFQDLDDGWKLPETYQWRFKSDPSFVHGPFKSRAEAENDFCDWASQQYWQSNTSH
jgi:hypothetical protein